MSKKLVLVRHGESVWNRDNLFTGWTDVDLSEKGVVEARKCGVILKDEGLSFDISYTSLLKRAIRTLWLILDEMDLMWLPVRRSWRLNEKHYGALQGLNKIETAEKYGDEQVLLWRRDYNTSPPPLERSDKRYQGDNPEYRDIDEKDIPLTESLKDTVERFLPYWHNEISRSLTAGKQVLIVAHGNSLRALVKHLDLVPDKDIVSLNIPTGIPLVYDLDGDLKPRSHHYLGDPEEIRKATEKIKSQGKKDTG